MNLLKNIFTKADPPILSNEDFWSWFVKNEKNFFNAVKKQSSIEEKFFDKLSPKLNELKEGFFFLTGMMNDNTVELVLTADGIIKNFVFVEQLVKDAPEIKGWKFTALKPSFEQKNFGIKMFSYEFNTDNIYFYANDAPDQPDEIDLTVIYNGFNDAL